MAQLLALMAMHPWESFQAMGTHSSAFKTWTTTYSILHIYTFMLQMSKLYTQKEEIHFVTKGHHKTNKIDKTNVLDCGLNCATFVPSAMLHGMLI